MMRFWYLFVVSLLTLSSAWSFGQDGFSDKTRALYILDISKYIEFDDSFHQQSAFIISILDKDDRLYWELERMSRTRKFVQEKPIKILLYSKIDLLGPANVVFVNSKDNYNISELLT